MKEAVEIPKERRVVHRAGGSGSSSAGSATIDHIWYHWDSFGGETCFVFQQFDGRVCDKVNIRKNGELFDSKRPTALNIGDGVLYEVIFDGLSYGDEVVFVVYLGSGENYWTSALYTYQGSYGLPPVVTESDGLINASMSSPYNKDYSLALGVLNFESDYGELNNYSREARNLAYVACLQSTEYHPVFGKVGNEVGSFSKEYDERVDIKNGIYADYWNSEAFISKFDTRGVQVPIGISETNNTDEATVSIFSNYINDWINDMNTLLGEDVFVRRDGIPEYDPEKYENYEDMGIRVILGTHKELWGVDIESELKNDSSKWIDFYYGTWAKTVEWLYDYSFYQSEVKLCTEYRGVMRNNEDFKDIVYEELTEATGCGNDTFHTYDSMFSQIWYTGKRNRLISNGVPTTDGEVVQLLYKELPIGEVASYVVHMLTPSIGAVVQLPCESYPEFRGKYTVSSFAINRKLKWDGNTWSFYHDSNSYSDIGAPTKMCPADWQWSQGEFMTYTDVDGNTNTVMSANTYVPLSESELRPVTAAEWNLFTRRIDEFRAYQNAGSYYGSYDVQRGDDFVSAYNEAVDAIQTAGYDANGKPLWGNYVSKIARDGTSKLSYELFSSIANELNAMKYR